MLIMLLKIYKSVQQMLRMMLRVPRPGRVWWRRQLCLAQPRSPTAKVGDSNVRMKSTRDEHQSGLSNSRYGAKQYSKSKASQYELRI
jgi:hypothetical protein